MLKRFIFLGLLYLVVCPSLWGGENWPAFRGPTGLGYCDEKDLPLHWAKDGAGVAWKSALVGQGHASPIVWGSKVIVCTVKWPENVSREHVIPEHHVLCYATADGKLAWDTLVPPGPWIRNDFRSGPGGGYAAPTPCTDGKLIYAVFSSSVIAAIDFDGKIVWRHEILPYTFDVTIGSSPMLMGDTVYMLCAMTRKPDSRLIAYDKTTGQTKWEQKLPEISFGHATPTFIDVNGAKQLLVMGCGLGADDHALQSVDPADGHVLWWCRGGTESSSPAFANNLVYFDSGRGGPGTCVDATGTGDASKTHVKWTANLGGGISSPIIVGKYLYRLGDAPVLKCVEIESGKQVYSHRLEGLSSTWASPIADPDGRIYFASAGKSVVIASGPEFKVLAENDLGDPSHPSAAVAKGHIYLVGEKNVYCIGAAP